MGTGSGRMERGHRRPSGEDGDGQSEPESRTVRGGDRATALASSSVIAAGDRCRFLIRPTTAGQSVVGGRVPAKARRLTSVFCSTRDGPTATAGCQCGFSSLRSSFMPPLAAPIRPLFSSDGRSRAAPSANDAPMSSRCFLSSSRPPLSAAFTHTASLAGDYARHAAVDD